MKTIVERPLLTEKTLSMAAKGWYSFVVDRRAGKQTIAKEIAARYAVSVKEIRTAMMHGKTRRVGRKMVEIQASDWKKAIVRLLPGQRIEAFEVTTQEQSTQK